MNTSAGTSNCPPSRLSPILQADPGGLVRARRSEIEAAIRRVLEGGRYILGPEVEEFETAWARYCCAGSVAGTASGTDALELSLRAVGIGPDDLVATVSHTAVATAAAIRRIGARLLLLDVDDETMTLAPGQVAWALESHPVRAVVHVHLYGSPGRWTEIRSLCSAAGVPLLEDAAQAHGACVGEHRTGSLGDLAAFSFYPTKNLPALGDAGAVCGPAPLVERVRELRQYGWRTRYVSAQEGINSRLDEVQAAILQVQLHHLDGDNARRAEIAAIYDAHLRDCGLRLPASPPGTTHVWHQYVIRHPNRASLAATLAARGIGSAVHYPLPIHLQPAYREISLIPPEGLPVTEKLCSEILSLPVHPLLTREQALTVSEAIRHWIDRCE